MLVLNQSAILFMLTIYYNGVPGRYFSYYSIYWNIFVALGLL